MEKSEESTWPSTAHTPAPPLLRIGDGIWVAEGSQVSFLGLRLGTRMTAIRLSDGSVWLHSPVRATEALVAAVAEIGPVSAIVAPNKYHHLFIAGWAKAHPEAKLYAAPGLIGKRPDLRFDEEMTDRVPEAWQDRLDQRIFVGSRLFDEVVFFHRPSRTAVLTDLIINVRLEDQSLSGRLWGWFEGVGWPDGATPILYRLTMADRPAARRVLEHILSWEPEQVVISHGEWFRTSGTAELRRRFGWLRG